MDQTFTIEMAELPTVGGLTSDPSVLLYVNDFLSNGSHLRKVNRLLEEDGCIIQYRSVIDCVLAEFKPDFKDACFAFYAGKGKPLPNLHPPETIEAIDKELVKALEVLISKEWPTFEEFKNKFKPR